MNAIAVGVVDDDDDVRKSIENLLRSAGYRPVCFSDAKSFLDSQEWARVSCVVTDLNMPGLSGLDLQKALAHARPGLPVILMTAYPTDEVREEAGRRGISAFFVKPIDGDLLIEQLEELLC